MCEQHTTVVAAGDGASFNYFIYSWAIKQHTTCCQALSFCFFCCTEIIPNSDFCVNLT